MVTQDPSSLGLHLLFLVLLPRDEPLIRLGAILDLNQLMGQLLLFVESVDFQIHALELVVVNDRVVV